MLLLWEYLNSTMEDKCEELYQLFKSHFTKYEEYSKCEGLQKAELETLLFDLANRYVPSEIPSWFYLTPLTINDHKHELIHITDSSNLQSILQHGLKKGTKNHKRLCQTRGWANNEQGYNFAFESDLLPNSMSAYGNCYLKLETDLSVRCHHRADKEDQTIFWGVDARIVDSGPLSDLS